MKFSNFQIMVTTHNRIYAMVTVKSFLRKEKDYMFYCYEHYVHPRINYWCPLDPELRISREDQYELLVLEEKHRAKLALDNYHKGSK